MRFFLLFITSTLFLSFNTNNSPMIRVDKTFTAKDNSFQVAFEGEPTYSNQVIPTSLGDIEMKSFRLPDA